MTALLPTTRKICWFSVNSLFHSSSDELQQPTTTPNSKHIGKDTDSQDVRQRVQLSALDRSNTNNNTSNKPANDNKDNSTSSPQLTLHKTALVKKKNSKNCNNTTSSKEKRFASKLSKVSESKNLKNMSNKISNKFISDNLSFSSWCKCVEQESNGTACCSNKKRARLSFDEAPFYLKFNPYITGGYRNNLTPFECVKSVLWWTNETLNIWSHLGGFVFFLALTVYDSLGLIDLPKTQPWDQVVITLLLICFMACMLLSTLYHVFCCCSEKFYRNWLSADLFGVSFCLLAIYISGIYYAFSCVPFWLNFYLVTVAAIFITALVMQIMPIVNKEDRFQWRLVVFGGWAAYGVVPTFHWALLHGAESEAVGMLLPRIVWIYIISGAAFFFYVARLPERVCPGIVNYIGSSHQIWHILIVLALYHWHNTGIMYLNFRATHPCSEEYKALYSFAE